MSELRNARFDLKGHFSLQAVKLGDGYKVTLKNTARTQQLHFNLPQVHGAKAPAHLTTSVGLKVHAGDEVSFWLIAQSSHILVEIWVLAGEKAHIHFDEYGFLLPEPAS